MRSTDFVCFEALNQVRLSLRAHRRLTDPLLRHGTMKPLIDEAQSFKATLRIALEQCDAVGQTIAARQGKAGREQTGGEAPIKVTHREVRPKHALFARVCAAFARRIRGRAGEIWDCHAMDGEALVGAAALLTDWLGTAHVVLTERADWTERKRLGMRFVTSGRVDLSAVPWLGKKGALVVTGGAAG